MILEIEKVNFEQEIGGVDLLGFQTAFEKTYTDKILPGITVLTWDVRYYGFICWAMFLGKNPSSPEFYEMEQKLAFRLAKHYRGKETVKYLGSLKASKDTKKFKPPYYKTPIWSQYKTSMFQLGLIEKNLNAACGYSLTGEGTKLAKLFNKANYGKERGLKDAGILRDEDLFLKILFNGDNTYSKIRMEFKKDLLKARKSDDFYMSLESSKKLILKNAAVTAQLIQKLTEVLLEFYDTVKNNKKITINDRIDDSKIASLLKNVREHFKKYQKISKENQLHGLSDLFKEKDTDMVEKIINRHLEVKANPLLRKSGKIFSITDNKRPDSAGFFGLRQAALDLLLKSLNRMKSE